ncbi:ComEC/Rec2 family competence protein, partial [Metapseudomonas otitidis]
MRGLWLALAGGLLALRFLPVLPPGWVLLALVGIGTLLLPWRTRALGVALIGFAWACHCAQVALDDRLDPALDGTTRWLQGQVVGLPQQEGGVVRFELVPTINEGLRLPGRLRVSWYGGPEVRSGETWRLAVTLRRPRGLVNPHTFDYEAWLLARHIGGTGTVKAGERLMAAEGPGAWRDDLRQAIHQAEARGRNGTIAALVLGDGSGLSSRDWRHLQDTGTVHLMVISGQHISLLALLLYGAVAALARLGLWPSRLPWLPCACTLALAGALGYGALAGFDVPVQRACLMTALVLLWRLRFRRLGVVTPLSAVLCIVLLVDPLASLQAGFWLSFAAVALLVLVFAGRLGSPPAWRSAWRAQWVLSLALTPALMALALPISLSGPLANLVAVPWVSLVSVPLSLAGTALHAVPGLGEGLLWLAGLSLEGLFLLLGWIAEAMPAWQAPALAAWTWALVLLGCLLLILPPALPFRLPGLLLLVLLVWPP